MPENLSSADIKEILEKYAESYDGSADKDGWFAGIKALCEPLGFCPNVKRI